MAASVRVISKVFSRVLPVVSHRIHQYQKLPLKTCPVPVLFGHPNRFYCSATAEAEALSRYKEKPWDYLESEEYKDRYGSHPVWVSYRRNHKGGIPPQKTRSTCIRGDKICGNPCPVCRDPNLIIHHQNVKLLQQFISPQTGKLYDPTRTGVCMKQQKNLNKAINTARDHGFLPFQIPHVEFSGEAWYSWYGDITPDQSEVAKVKKMYKNYLK